MSYTKIDDYLWKVRSYMMRQYGCTTADREIDPLVWYVRTGRATIDFLKRLYAVKPYIIARILHKGGSHLEAIEAIKSRIGFMEG